MTIDRFKDELTDCVIKLAKPGEEITLRTITKNNNTTRLVLSVKVPGGITVPSFYISELKHRYDSGMSIDKIAEEVLKRGRAHTLMSVPEDVLSDDYSRFNVRIIYRLINYEEKREFISERPHRQLLDLAVVYYYYSREGDMNLGHISVNNSDIEKWGITEDDLYRDASCNTPALKPAVIKPLSDYVIEVFPEKEQSFDVTAGFPPGPWEIKDLSMIGDAIRNRCYVPLIVLTNELMNCGAATILYKGLVQAISDEIGSDLYIIPSSIHEVLIIPCVDYVISPEELNAMIVDINVSTVSEEDVLANHAYLYDRERGVMKPLG
ncbi:MAG: DUF5688 family protein [Lachnospiraceae bacterium]|nr:DUF5688 family protein [Lachnospiraceae bacterium]